MTKQRPPIHLLVLSLIAMALTSCAPAGLPDKDLALIKGANESSAAASKAVATLQSTVNSQATQLAALQKQLIELSNKQSAYATQADLAIMQSGAVNVTDLKARLSTVEGQFSQLKTNNDVLRLEFNTRVSGIQGTVDKLAAMFQGASPTQTDILYLKAQVEDLKARMVSHGW